MIIDVARFINEERPYWEELESLLGELRRDPARRLTLEEARRFHYLYERTAADLSKVAHLASEPRLHAYLEPLVAEAYAEVHETRRKKFHVEIGKWLSRTFPQTFRKHANAFSLSATVFLIGAILGAGIILFDYDSKSIVTPFPQLLGDPSDRVAMEEQNEDAGELSGAQSTFAAMLMVNNTRVSILALALGMTFGVGTVVVLFYNGVMIGAVACDYVMAGETVFLLGWLLPHGAIEIPAILIAGQGGLVLGGALIGWGAPLTMRARLERVRGDLVTLIFGVALFLVWAGIIEAFISQYHQPVLVYWAKILFGLVEIALLTFYLRRVGRSPVVETGDTPPVGEAHYVR